MEDRMNGRGGSGEQRGELPQRVTLRNPSGADCERDGSDLGRLCVAQAAVLASLTPRHLRRAIERGELRHVRVGRHRVPMTTQAWLREWATVRVEANVCRRT